jgi:hypothetical protein
MPTFLTTPKMAPALAARVEASVRGKRNHASGRAMRPRGVVHLVTIVRFGVPMAIVAMVTTVVHFVRQDRLELERARTSLIDTVRTESASLTPDDLTKVSLVGLWLSRLSGSYDGDVIDDGLRPAGALDAALSRTAIYVRGPVASFSTTASVAEVAAASSKDAFARCLVAPPASRSEKVVLTGVLTTHGGSDAFGAHLHRLDDAEVILPILQPAWADGVRLAPDIESVMRLRRQLDKTPVERGVPALKASLLLVAMDEASHGGPTELDGEAPHDIRVGLVDLVAGKVLLRLRKHVDPAWISSAKRSMYAGALDGCVLAMDVRDAVGGAAK